MSKVGLRRMASATFCATCFALAAAWPSQGTQANDDFLDKQRVVAVGSERIECGRREVRILRGNQPLELPRFRELLVANAVGHEASLAKFSGRRVAIVKSLKMRDQWEVYANAVWRGKEGLSLAENVFELKKVVSSSDKAPIEVHVDGRTLRLKPGQILLVLG